MVDTARPSSRELIVEIRHVIGRRLQSYDEGIDDLSSPGVHLEALRRDPQRPPAFGTWLWGFLTLLVSSRVKVTVESMPPLYWAL
jgi:hypothetical protein